METTTINEPSFYSRNIKIRDSQWVCRQVNSYFPHISTTRQEPMYINVLSKYLNEPVTYDNFESKIPYKRQYFGFIKKINMLFMHPEKKKLYKQVQKIYDLIDKLCYSRSIAGFPFGNRIKASLDMLQNFKIGNCGEEADIAEMILKINGINNAVKVNLSTDKKLIDHAACLFNSDGSEFKGIINNSTIIVDPWFGKADYAKNMIVHYKANGNILGILPKDKIKFSTHQKDFISKNEIEKLQKRYPELVFSNHTNRKLMEN